MIAVGIGFSGFSKTNQTSDYLVPGTLHFLRSRTRSRTDVDSLLCTTSSSRGSPSHARLTR
jgi:hypothetical protein